jgi:PmbA protein
VNPGDLAAHALTFLPGEGQATVERERSLMLRYARSAPTQATGIDDASVHLLALRDGHAGAATTNVTDDDALRATAQRAVAAAEAAARAAGGSGDHPGLPAPPSGGYRTHDGYDAATAEGDPAPGGAALAAAFAVAAEHGLEAFGTWTSGAVETAIASSTGVLAVDRVTDAYMKVMCRDARARTGQATQAAVAVGGLDPVAIARAAAAKVSPEEPVALEPGEYPVVLDAEAVGGLLEMLADLAFNGLAHAEAAARSTAASARASPRRPSTSPTPRASRAPGHAPSTSRACPRRRCR